MMQPFKVGKGTPYPLGATLDNSGVNFAVFSSCASQITLCLFDESGNEELAQIPMRLGCNQIWHCHVEGLKVGQVYGLRADGDYDISGPKRFNRKKLLLDPYAKSIVGQVHSGEAHLDYQSSDEGKITAASDYDNAVEMAKSKVMQLDKFTAERLAIPWSKSLIYECHVKGATQLHPNVPEQFRGKFLGLCTDAFITHLKQLGITAIQLLPVHAFVNEPFLQQKGLTNYWGYNTLSFFAPHPDYLVNNDVTEFQHMVRTLHDNSIEVFLDVVFNHTAEGNALGQTFNLRGLDNQAYYRLHHESADTYINDTGCGNTLNLDHPRTLQLVLDSLRYWVEYMGVDGFRFDLATILGRNQAGFSAAHPFFYAIAQDPILSQVKLIAEPWDIGPGGYQLGAFPMPWHEWNDKFRDTVRKYWRGDDGVLPEFAKRIHGSSDLFEHNGRGPFASINFLTSHDGFTLRDCVTYEHKHNEANREENRDGHSENYSCNYGTEGETQCPETANLRLKQQLNMLLTLLFSQGVPMISAGTELAHTQQGNNNAYCQDNEINWLDWQNIQTPFSEFIAKALKLRHEFKALTNNHYIHSDNPHFEICWLTANGLPMTGEQWHQSGENTMGYLLCARESNSQRKALLCLFNPADQTIPFYLPEREELTPWHIELSTEMSAQPSVNTQANCVVMTARSALVLSANHRLSETR